MEILLNFKEVVDMGISEEEIREQLAYLKEEHPELFEK
jgi:hypothetical protein